jgi:hypothetical protein
MNPPLQLIHANRNVFKDMFIKAAAQVLFIYEHPQ